MNIPAPEIGQFVDQQHDDELKKNRRIRFDLSTADDNNSREEEKKKKTVYYDIPTRTTKAVAATRFDTKPSSPPFEKTDTWKERVIGSPEVSDKASALIFCILPLCYRRI